MPISSSRSSNFYTKILSAGIDSPIAGLTANDSTKLIFSTMTPNGICCNGDSSTDPVNPVFTRSTTCWAKNIDTSPISPWNNGGGYPAPEHAGGFGGTGTLISPRHVLFASHFRIKIGKKLIFVDMNNNCYIRTLSNSLQVGSSDIRIGLLDSDLPSNVSFCKVASFDFSTLGTTTNKIPVFYTDQQRKALIAIGYGQTEAPESYFIEPPNLNSTSQENAQRANFYELPIGGDSGSPICFVYNNKLILLFTFIVPWSGSSAPYHINAINSVMTTLGGGYTLSIFNKEDIVSQEKNVSIKKQNLTSLKPYSITGGSTVYDPNAVYIFKGGSINTISTVFNYLELQGGSSYSTADGIYIPSLGTYVYYKNSGIGGTGWRTNGGADATNLVINNNDLIYFTPRSYKEISVGSGAIIQKYDSGKISLFFDTLPLNTQSIKLNLGYEIGCGNDFVLTQNGVWSQNGCDYYVRWDNKNGTLPYKWRFFYSSDGRTDYASHPTAGPDSLPKKGWSNGMTISENQLITFGQSLVLNNLPFDADANCNFSIFNRTWIYLGAPSFRYGPIDNLSYHITTPLTPDEYGGNGSYQIRGSDEVYFTNSYNNSDKFPSNNWRLGSYINNNCPQITTTPIFSLL